MTGYIVLGSLLILSLVCCAWLSSELQKSEKALAEEKNRPPIAPSSVTLIRAERSEIKKISAVIIDAFGAPADMIEQELSHKLAGCLPEFWTIERRPDRTSSTFGIEYRATIYVCPQEEATYEYTPY